MKKVPGKILKLVKDQHIILSAKARGELDSGFFDTDDLIYSIVYGQVVKKEKDEYKDSQYKYTIIGPSRSGAFIYSCGKIVKLLEKKYFIITFHEAR